MTELFKPKYLLMKVLKNTDKKFQISNNRTLSHNKMNTSAEFNRTNILQFKAVERSQSDIQSLIWRIGTQTKKNEVLKILIQLMQKQSLFNQQESKKTQQVDFLEHSKIVKKINYDIDKILQKNNEEIANLFSLKEQISCKRSERVVYSNLFRKIQSQLKNAIQIYQQELIKSEVSKNQKQLCIFSSGQDLGETNRQRNFKKNEEDELSGDRFGNSNRHSHMGFHLETLHTKKKKHRHEKGQSKFITEFSGFPDSEEKSIEHKFEKIRNKIILFELETQKILQRTNSKNFSQLDACVQNVGNENQLLEEELQLMTKKMEEIQKEQKIFLNQKKTSEIVQQSGLPKSRLRLRNFKSGKALSTQSEISSRASTDQQIIQALIEQFRIYLQSQLQRFDEIVFKLDEKVETLIRVEYTKQFPVKFSQDNVLRYEPQNQKQINSLLNSILDKMDVINQSQKLYEKSWFCDAYKRQLSKVSKKDMKKK